MLKKTLVTFASLLLLIGAGCGASVTSNGSVDSMPTPSEQPAPTPAPTSTDTSGSAKTYAMTEVATHKDGTSCWSTINGSVYDLTTWIPQHPGGSQAIAALCGKDGTAAFNGQHGGSAMQENKLATFKIGVLKK